jgi:FMN phosphatase YigB (HAD superfamily)
VVPCRKWFDKVVLGEECANPKPYPDPYQEGLKAFGVKPEETIICEDSPSGEAQPLFIGRANHLAEPVYVIAQRGDACVPGRGNHHRPSFSYPSS